MPRVAVTAAATPEWNENGPAYTPYRDAVLAAGLDPVHTSPATFDPGDSRSVSAFLRSVDGLLLSGGPDVSPHYYIPNPEGFDLDGFIRQHGITTDLPRDALELSLLQAAVENGIPVLAICRGIQLLNVAMGGELIPDIRSSTQHKPNVQNGPSATHAVTVRRRTLLAGVLEASKQHLVNSRHHQGFTEAQAAVALRVSAVAPDGIVEAVELVGGPWTLGVQWHPERPEDEHVFARDKAIFAAFAAQVRKHSERNR